MCDTMGLSRNDEMGQYPRRVPVPQEMLARELSTILEYIFPVPRTVPHREMGHAGMWGNFGSVFLKMWWVHVPPWRRWVPGP